MSSASSSVGRNSLIMASGTLASRITGQIRTILLAGALGVTGIAADAYQVGSQIPQVVFNILAGGLLNAILVPQIVKAFKKKDYASRINKLLTLSVIVLGAFTLLLMLATPLLVRIYVNSGWTAPQRALASAFTLWCMPQVFFYGLYTVMGQVLAAKDRFGAYAWSSVGANVISCLGFGAFILLFGNAQRQPLTFWTNSKIALSAGTWTLGVAVQALILVVPLVRLGIKLHPEFGFRGIGLRSMGKVAVWSLGMVLLDQLAGVVNTRVTTGAPVAAGDRLGTAGSQAYMQAFQIWILPYSLITVSLATAIFPRLSRAFAEKRVNDARSELSGALRSSGAIMIYFTAAFIAIPVPIIRSLLPSVGVQDASAMAIALISLSFGLLPASAALLMRRTFFAYEDGRSPFLLSLIQNLSQVVLLEIGIRFINPHYWVGVVGGSVALSNVVLLPIAYTMIRRRMDGRIDGRRIVALYARTLLAGVAITLVGLIVSGLAQRFMGAQIGGANPHLGWVQAVAISAIVAIVMALIYIVLLYAMRVNEVTAFLKGLKRRLPGHPKNSGSPENKQTGANEKSGQPSENSHQKQTTETENTGIAKTTRVSEPAGSSHGTPPSRMTSDTNNGSVRHMIPAIGDTINNRYTLIALYRSEPGLSAWLANDHTLARDCQLFLISDTSKIAKVNAIASSLALSRDPHFTHVLHLEKFQGVSIIVTDKDAGVSLHELMSQEPHKPLSVEAMRTITGEIAQAADSLRKVSLNHQAISSHTVRVTSNEVTLADAPVSPLLTTPIKQLSFNDSDEMLAIRQIGGVLFEMITGIEFDPNADPSRMREAFAARKDDIPLEFVSICSRTLSLQREGAVAPVPIFTMVELLALLGSWQPMADLKKSDVDVPPKQGGASIESATLAPVQPKNLLEIPEALVASNTVQETGGSAEQASPWRPNQLLFGGNKVEEVKSDSPNFLSAFENSFHSSLHQLDDIDDELTDDGMKSVPDEEKSTSEIKAQPAAKAEPTASLAGEATPEQNQPESTEPSEEHSHKSSVAPLIPEGATEPEAPVEQAASESAQEKEGAEPQAADAVPLPSESELEAAQEEHKPRSTSSRRVARSTEHQVQGSSSLAELAGRGQTFTPSADDLENPDFVDENIGEVTSIIQPISATAQPKLEGPEKEKKPKGKSLVGRNITLVVAGIVLVLALVWAIFQLGITSPTGSSTSGNSTWSINVNNAPAPNGEPDNSSAKKAPAKKQSTPKKAETPKKSEPKKTEPVVRDKDAQKVPNPAVTPVTNTNPYPIGSTRIVRATTNGTRGIGLQIHLTQPQNVQRVRITARYGGGQAQLYANSTVANPQNGTALANFSFAMNRAVTQVDLPQPVNTQDLVIWVSAQPQNGFYYQNVTVY